MYQANTPPVAMDDTWSVARNGVLKISTSMLLANDSDAENSPLKLVNFSQPQKGQIAMNEEDELVFRAADGFIGTDRFTYSIADDKGASSSASVIIYIPERISLSESQFVNFKFNSAEMTEGSQLIFDQILRELKESPDLSLNVFTFTDSKGSENFNMRLSEARADAIVDAFSSEGIDEKRFYVKAMGEKNPIADNSTEEGRAINRRGEFILRQNAP
jgi:outer membrane protein OmpA-like peptidoglycan-associated protein